MNTPSRIGIVGPCKSGKTTLMRNLEAVGYQAHQIAQEHSFAPSMWQRITDPDILIYLHCDYESTLERGLKWTRVEYEAQAPRLAHARENADLAISTDQPSPEEVLEQVVAFLKDVGAVGKSHT